MSLKNRVYFDLEGEQQFRINRKHGRFGRDISNYEISEILKYVSNQNIALCSIKIICVITPKTTEGIQGNTSVLKNIHLEDARILNNIEILLCSHSQSFIIGEHLLRTDLAGPSKSKSINQNSAAHLYFDKVISGAAVKSGTVFENKIDQNTGHISIFKHIADAQYETTCKIKNHGDCLNSLASISAIEQKWEHVQLIKSNLARTRMPGLIIDHQTLHYIEKKQKILGFYIGQALAAIALKYQPSHIYIEGAYSGNRALSPWIKGFYIAALKTMTLDNTNEMFFRQIRVNDYISTDNFPIRSSTIKYQLNGAKLLLLDSLAKRNDKHNSFV
ncbi:MAG: hypothetical protein COA69_03390 [Robiginitomaculum sp.]|nr:MAG: hypothetical protein COA69_03390 [Robiginitomaculum sp.]